MVADYVIGKLMIGKREYDVKDCELNQSELKFYIDNPRVYSSLRNFDGNIPTQAEIENYMCDMEHVKQLKLSIKENGGLIDPLIVRDGDFVVLEGNSRLAAYRLLCANDPVRWGKVKCKVLPADIDDKAIFTLLGQYHIVGRKDWSPYEQAGYLYRRHKETKLPIESIANELGITKGNAENYIKVFQYMIDIDDMESSRWSYYEELLKNRNIQKAIIEHPELENTIVTQIKTDKIEAAADIRKFGKVAGDKTKLGKKVLKEVASGQKDVYEALIVIQDAGNLDKVFEKVENFRDYVLEDSFKELINNSVKKNDILFMLKKINQKINNIIKEFKDEQ